MYVQNKLISSLELFLSDCFSRFEMTHFGKCYEHTTKHIHVMETCYRRKNVALCICLFSLQCLLPQRKTEESRDKTSKRENM